MSPDQFRLVAVVLDAGPEDRAFDWLLFAGLLLTALIAVLGRDPVTVGVVVAYLAGILGYVLYKWLS